MPKLGSIKTNQNHQVVTPMPKLGSVKTNQYHQVVTLMPNKHVTGSEKKGVIQPICSDIPRVQTTKSSGWCAARSHGTTMFQSSILMFSRLVVTAVTSRDEPLVTPRHISALTLQNPLYNGDYTSGTRVKSQDTISLKKLFVDMHGSLKNKAAHPNFPPEIWLQIFQFATYVPDILAPEIYDHSSTIGWLFNRDHHRAIRDSLVMKRYLVQVCKMWYILASPYLYSTLMSSARGTHPFSGERPLGSWTERLDIAMRDQSPTHGELELDFLAEAIRCMPNLAIVSFAVRAPQYDHFALPNFDFAALLASATGLRVVNHIFSFVNPHGAYYPAVPSVQTLGLCSELSEEAYSRGTKLFPSLREIIYHHVEISPNALWQRSFLPTYGGNLTSVHFLDNTCSPNVDLGSELARLSLYCPCLRSLVLSLPEWAVLPLKFDLPPLYYFGLRCDENQVPKKGYAPVFAALQSLHQSVPTLQVVRFTDRYNVIDMRKKPAHLRRGLESLRDCHFRVEDHEGRSLLQGTHDELHGAEFGRRTGGYLAHVQTTAPPSELENTELQIEESGKAPVEHFDALPLPEGDMRGFLQMKFDLGGGALDRTASEKDDTSLASSGNGLWKGRRWLSLKHLGEEQDELYFKYANVTASVVSGGTRENKGDKKGRKVHGKRKKKK
ncbi:hypothetical protein BV22DRAFT_1049843, partial [Leucogyrophana mollusca]